MKIVTRFLVVAALAAAPVGLQADPTTPVQPGTSCPSQTGFDLKQLPFRVGHPKQSGAPRTRLWESTSGNWSGYAVPLDTSGVKDTFSSVQGSWVVPTVTGTEGSAAYAATWVGLDGYDDGTVEQTGTLQEWTGSKQVNYAWFEMYPNPMYEIEATVEVGDAINATVSYGGKTSVSVGRGRTEEELVFNVTIADVTQKWTESVPTSYTTIPSAELASAEWIMEAPSSGEILPLANFTTATFSDCYAASSGSGGTFKAINYWPFDPLTMIDPEGGESSPSSAGLIDNGTSFTVDFTPYTPPPPPPTRGHGGR
jgi:hypothetical protein